MQTQILETFFYNLHHVLPQNKCTAIKNVFTSATPTGKPTTAPVTSPQFAKYKNALIHHAWLILNLHFVNSFWRQLLIVSFDCFTTSCLWRMVWYANKFIKPVPHVSVVEFWLNDMFLRYVLICSIFIHSNVQYMQHVQIYLQWFWYYQ